MRTTKTPGLKARCSILAEKWWLIGYLTGDSTLRRYGLRTSTSDPLIAERIKRYAESWWVRPPDPPSSDPKAHKKPLWIFKIDDPEIIRTVEQIRRSYRFPKLPKPWLAGYLDADGTVRDSGRAGEVFSIDYELIRLITRVAIKLKIKASITISAFKDGRLRKNPIYRVYLRPIDKLPSVKVSRNKSRL